MCVCVCAQPNSRCSANEPTDWPASPSSRSNGGTNEQLRREPDGGMPNECRPRRFVLVQFRPPVRLSGRKFCKISPAPRSARLINWRNSFIIRPSSRRCALACQRPIAAARAQSEPMCKGKGAHSYRRPGQQKRQNQQWIGSRGQEFANSKLGDAWPVFMPSCCTETWTGGKQTSVAAPICVQIGRAHV